MPQGQVRREEAARTPSRAGRPARWGSRAPLSPVPPPACRPPCHAHWRIANSKNTQHPKETQDRGPPEVSLSASRVAGRFGRPAEQECAHQTGKTSRAVMTVWMLFSRVDPGKADRLARSAALGRRPASPRGSWRPYRGAGVPLRRPPRALSPGGRASAAGTLRGRPGPRLAAAEGRPPPPARAARQGAPPRQARTHGRRPSGGRDEGRRSRRRAPARAARRCGARASFAPPRARRSTPLVHVHLEHTRRPRGREWRPGHRGGPNGRGNRPGIARAGAASNRSTTARIIARLSRRGGDPAGPCRSADLARRPRRRMRSRPCLTRSPAPPGCCPVPGGRASEGRPGVGRGRAEGYIS